MSWPRDDAKLDRVRALMGDHDLDALVVHAIRSASASEASRQISTGSPSRGKTTAS